MILFQKKREMNFKALKWKVDIVSAICLILKYDTPTESSLQNNTQMSLENFTKKQLRNFINDFYF